jgi:hypothetical protein
MRASMPPPRNARHPRYAAHQYPRLASPNYSLQPVGRLLSGVPRLKKMRGTVMCKV